MKHKNILCLTDYFAMEGAWGDDNLLESQKEDKDDNCTVEYN